MNWIDAEKDIQDGWAVTRPHWACKIIRRYRESDIEYFNNEFDSDKAIVQECNQPCTCKVGIWIPEPGDKESNDWTRLYHQTEKKEKK